MTAFKPSMETGGSKPDKDTNKTTDGAAKIGRTAAVIWERPKTGERSKPRPTMAAPIIEAARARDEKNTIDKPGEAAIDKPVVTPEPLIPVDSAATSLGGRLAEAARRHQAEEEDDAEDEAPSVARRHPLAEREQAHTSTAHDKKDKPSLSTDEVPFNPLARLHTDRNDGQAVAEDREDEFSLIADEARPDHESEESAELNEQDTTLAELTPEEAHYTVEAYVQGRRKELATEQGNAEPNSPEAAALAADAEMLDKLHDMLEAAPAASPAAITEQAFQETMATLPSAEDEELQAAEAIEPVGQETVTPDEAVAEATPAHADQPPMPPGHTGEAVADEPDRPPVPPEILMAGAPAAEDADEATGQPPLPPRPPYGPGSADFPPPDVPPPFPAQLAALHPEVAAPAIVAPERNIISIEEAMHYERRAETRGLLVGGLVGYFVGRRRGRIKTEKRLLPVQEKLEKQVRDLHEVVASKEAALREEAARRVVQARERTAAQKQSENLVAQPQAASALARGQHMPDRAVMPAPAAELAAKAAQGQVIEARPAQAEFVPLPPMPGQTMPMSTHEQLGTAPDIRLVTEVAAASAAMAATAATALEHNRHADHANVAESGTVDTNVKELAVERIKQLKTNELVAASEKVIVGGERLSDIYTSKRISEPGLRHIMMEYTRGGNVEQVVQQEIHNKELTYERDPRMRKQLAASLSAASEKASSGAKKAVQAAKPVITAQAKRAKDVSKKVAGQVANQASATAKKLDNPGNPMQQVIVRTWVAVTVVLTIIALILLIR